MIHVHEHGNKESSIVLALQVIVGLRDDLHCHLVFPGWFTWGSQYVPGSFTPLPPFSLQAPIILVKHVALHCLCMPFFLHLTAPSTQLSNQNFKANREGERKSNTETGTDGKPKVSIEKWTHRGWLIHSSWDKNVIGKTWRPAGGTNRSQTPWPPEPGHNSLLLVW